VYAPIVAPELFERVHALIERRRTRTPTKRNARESGEALELERFAPVHAAWPAHLRVMRQGDVSGDERGADFEAGHALDDDEPSDASRP
jgi:hypothetical protein